jgi:hypothetical protein
LVIWAEIVPDPVGISGGVENIKIDKVTDFWMACQAVARGRARLRPNGLRRGSLHSLRERRLVGPAGLPLISDAVGSDIEVLFDT